MIFEHLPYWAVWLDAKVVLPAQRWIRNRTRWLARQGLRRKLALAGALAVGAAIGALAAKRQQSSTAPRRSNMSPAAERLFALRLDTLERHVRQVEALIGLAQAPLRPAPTDLSERYAELRRREAAVAESALKVMNRRPDLLPLPAGMVTSAFGDARLHPITERTGPHRGVDLAAPVGTPVRAAGAGFIMVRTGAPGFGVLVEVDHRNGYRTRYAHLGAAPDSSARLVGRGEVVGYVGDTGLSTGPHLHFEVLRDGRPVDPFPFLAAGLDSGRLGVRDPVLATAPRSGGCANPVDTASESPLTRTTPPASGCVPTARTPTARTGLRVP